MALHRTQPLGGILTVPDAVRVLLLVVAAIVVIAALNMAFGMPHPGPMYEIVPDPAGPLPF